MPRRNPVDPRFGERMRALLRQRGLSFRALAARTYHGKSHLHDLAVGRKAPTPDVARRIDDALGAGGTLAALADPDAAAAPPAWGDGWHRADAEHLADMLTRSAPTPGNAAALAHQWLIADPPQLYELRAGRRVGHATVERVEHRVAQLRRLDDHIGGHQTYALVTAELSATADLLRAGAYTEPVGRRLLSAAADLCQLGGFIAADTGRRGDARRLYLAGMRAGHAAGDPATAGNNLSALAYLEANIGDPREAVTLARTAYVGARAAADPAGRALLLERAAWAHARAGDAGPAERTLGSVDDAYAQHRPGEAAPWAYWLTPDEVEIMAGRVWTQLRRPLRAVPILRRAVARYGDDVPRETALYLTWLAEALVQAGEVDEAADAAVRALRLARRAGSQRAGERAAEVGRLVVAVGGGSVPAAELAEELDTGGGQ